LIAEQWGKVSTHLDDVREFHEAFGVPVAEKPKLPAAAWDSGRQAALDNAIDALEALVDAMRAATDGGAMRWLRIGLMAEEMAEYLTAEDDALGDIGVIADGTALSYGIPLDDVRREIHRSNISKLDSSGRPIKRSDGKIMKSERYSPPDIAGLLKAASENNQRPAAA